MKRKIAFLIFMNLAATSFAGQQGVNVAKIDKDAARPFSKKISVPVVTEKYEYYEVRGETEKDLRCQMTQNGCKWDDGKRYDSVTKWNVKWDYDYDRAPDSCSAESFRAAVEVTFRFPKWVHDEYSPTALTEKWDRYMQSLIVHENGHRDLAVTAAAELGRAVSELPPAATCADIDRNIRNLCREYMQKLNDDQKAYDSATVHGTKQGAVFP